MQNVPSEKLTDNPKIADKVCSTIATGSPPQSTTSNSSPAKSVETETYSEHRRYMSDSSESEDDSVSEVESFMIDQDFDEDSSPPKFLLNPAEERTVDPETQERLEQLLQVAGIGQLASKDGKHLGDPEVLRRLTSSVSCALDEAAAALTRMRSDSTRPSAAQAAVTSAQISASAALQAQSVTQQITEKTSLVEACTDGDVGTVRKLLTEGRSVHETSEEGESLLSLACSAGYFELAQVLLAMHANVEDRGIKGECTPLMEAASAGHLEIVKLLVSHGADVNAQSTSGNTPLMYACAGGHQDVVRYLLENGANVEDHNENGHTPLMEAASAGHVALARILLAHGAGINTHSNEFKESALTLACYKGHLDMVRFLLEAGADQEHKTDEMHTALMEASMDGHVEVARLLLDSGAQVNMPTDSFESPLTLAACGGHVDLAMLLIERGANIEEVNDEGYTPLMEAAREGHEEMVHLLLGQGANINAQTDETQETALTLACCGGFTEVADILLKGGADIELGASTPLMEASQEGHLELVRFLLENNANVHTQTQTGDTALTYACENGHTDVADLLLQYGADLEHESEGGRTPLMKACRAGHLCTVQFLISKGANVRRQTTNNDHTPLSLACAGGHLPVVELLLSHNADPGHKLKDNSTMLIEAAKGGHTNVVQLLLDYPHSMGPQQQVGGQIGATTLSMLPGQVGGTNRESPLPNQQQATSGFFQPPSAILQEVPEAVRIVRQDDMVDDPPVDVGPRQMQARPDGTTSAFVTRKSVLPKSRSAGTLFDGNLTSAEAQQVRTQPLKGPDENDGKLNKGTNFPYEVEIEEDDEVPTLEAPGLATTGMVHMIKNRTKQFNSNGGHVSGDEGSTQKQQILEELHRVERDFHTQAHNHAFPYAMSHEQCPSSVANNPLPHMLNIDIAMSQQKQGLAAGLPLFPCNLQNAPNAFYNAATGQTPKLAPVPEQQPSSAATAAAVFAQHQQQQQQNSQQSYYFAPVASTPLGLSTSAGVQTNTVGHQPMKFHSVTSLSEVSQNTAISDRPKAKPVSKKEGKNLRKQQQQQQQAQQQHQQQVLQQQAQQHAQQQQVATFQPGGLQMFSHMQLQQNQQIQSQQFQPLRQQADGKTPQEILNFQGLDLDSIESETLVLKNENHDLLTASILQQFHSTPALRAAFLGGSPQKSRLELYDHNDDTSKVTRLELTDKDFSTVDDVVQTLESLHTNEVQPSYSSLDESMIASLTVQQDLPTQADLSRVEYFAVPTNGAQVPVHTLYPYDHYLGTGLPKEQLFQAGFQAGYNLMQQQLSPSEAMNNASMAQITSPVTPNQPQYISGLPPQQQPICAVQQPPCSHVPNTGMQQPPLHHCQSSCAQHPQLPQTHHQATHQVQVATQTPQATQTGNDLKKARSNGEGIKVKKGRVMRHQNQMQQGGNFQGNPNYQIDHNAAITQYSGGNPQCPSTVISPCMDVDSETESNHDTALTLACAGGHDELVELLISRGADIEHRDKKGFTPLILAATAGHEKVVETLLNHSADIEAQSERTKDTPLSLACSGGRYEVVELLLNRNANKEHRNVSDYTPLSLAASGGYVNIIKLLLSHGAEINSRTGSKLGISPLMLAAMNGHTAAVKLLLDMGSDINAQIETNRNTALTLACFQGRHEVVSLLLDRKANVEHRAKTGLTPLMEAASGGYVDVGRVLLDKGADVNATPVPSSRDTALTIAADKGHVRFVELLLCRGAQVEVKNKKGNSPLWLAANGGHLPVVELLYNVHADIDSQDNRKVSCLMAAFRKGHVKVVKWMVHHVTQFPSDQEMLRYNTTISDKELLEKCQECVKIIRAAKETQAAKANKNASILLEELESEKTREESKRLAAARRRERKKKKKLEKKEERRKLLEENRKNENFDEKRYKKDLEEEEDEIPEPEPPIKKSSSSQTSARNNNMEASISVSTSAHSSTTASQLSGQSAYTNGNDKDETCNSTDNSSHASSSTNENKTKEKRKEKKKKKSSGSNNSSKNADSQINWSKSSGDRDDDEKEHDSKKNMNLRRGLVFEATKSPAERDDFEATGNEVYVSSKKKTYEEPTFPCSKNSSSPKQQFNKREEGWKEVVRKSSVQTISTGDSGMKKVSVPSNAISRVIGRGGSNINAIRGATGAYIEVEKQNKGQSERIITIKGSSDATKQAHSLIATLIKDPDVDILTMLPKTTNNKTSSSATTLWDKTQIGTKKNTGKVLVTPAPNVMVFNATSGQPKTSQAVSSSNPTSTTGGRFTISNNSALSKPRASSASATTTTVRSTVSKMATQLDKNVINSNHVNEGSIASSIQSMTISHHTVTAITMSGPTMTSKVSTASIGQTFAAKLTEATSSSHIIVNNKVHPSIAVKPKTTTITSSHMQMPLPSQQQHHVMNSAEQMSPPLSHHHQGWDGMTSTIVNSDLHSSPSRSEARPHSTPSASPNMHQHFHNLGKISPMFGTSETNQNTASENVMNSLRSSTPNLTPSNNIHQVLALANYGKNVPKKEEPTLPTTPTYTLFRAGGVDHWNRCTTGDQHDHSQHHEMQSQKINFAAVTGGVAGGSTVVCSSQSINQGHSAGSHTGKYVEHEMPKQVDVSKAPGYRGVAVCSPVSSKTSSNSTTPPNIAGNGTYPTYQDTTSQSSVSPTGNNVVNRPEVSQENTDYFAELFKSGAGNMPMLNLSNDGHLLQSSYNNTLQFPYVFQGLTMAQQQASLNIHNASMSRLNPKAPEYSFGMQSKTSPSGLPSQQHIYNNGYPAMGNVYMSKQVGDGYHQRGMSSAQQNRMWMPVANPPFNAQSEQLISGIAGLTLHNIAKYAVNDGLENGDLGGMVAAPGSSPNLSPNMQSNLPPNHMLHQASNTEVPPVYGGLEERKPPQPIGTGRKTAYVPTNQLENWRMNVDKNEGWSMSNGTDYALREVRNHLCPEELEAYTRQLPSIDMMNGQPYFNQPPLSTARSDYMKALPKLDIMTSWDNTSQPMQELQEKQHGWTNKWNQ